MSDTPVQRSITIKGDRPWSASVEPTESKESAGVADKPLDPAVRAAAEMVKAFLKSATTLLETRLAEHRPYVPRHLTEKCHALILGCTDAIVIRYDVAHDGKNRIGLAMADGPVRNIVPAISGGVAGFADSDVSLFKGGTITFMVTKADGSESQPLGKLVAKVTFDPATLTTALGRPALIGRLENQFELNLVGEEISNETNESKPFITRSRMRFPVGFDAIEIYAGLNPSEWQPSLAEHWAEREITAATARTHVLRERFAQLDPYTEARRTARSLLANFEALLDGDEEPVHRFLRVNPYLLCPTGIEFKSKLPFGKTVSDFVVRRAGEGYLLVELEKPNRQLFREDGQQTQYLTHALDQIADWIRYIQDNLATVQRELGLPGLTPNPECWVVMGRSSSLSVENRRKIQVIESQMPRVRILTYEDVISIARQNYENLFGTLNVGQSSNTEIYYPKSLDSLPLPGAGMPLTIGRSSGLFRVP